MLLRRPPTIHILAATLCAVAVALSAGPSAEAARQPPSGPPDTRITFGPEGWTNLTQPVFAYESDDPDARFECRMDSEPFAPCGIVEYEAYEEQPGRKLTDGHHRFEVRAINEAGEVDPTPARAPLIVDTSYPSGSILSRPGEYTLDRRPKFTFALSGVDEFFCTIRGEGLKIKVRSCDGRHSFRSPRRLPDGAYIFVLGYSNRAGSGEVKEIEFHVGRRPLRTQVRDPRRATEDTARRPHAAQVERATRPSRKVSIEKRKRSSPSPATSSVAWAATLG